MVHPEVTSVDKIVDLLPHIFAAVSAFAAWRTVTQIRAHWRADRKSEIYRPWRDLVTRAQDRFASQVQGIPTDEGSDKIVASLTRAVYSYRAAIRGLVSTEWLDLTALRRALMSELERCENELSHYFDGLGNANILAEHKLASVLQDHCSRVVAILDKHDPLSKHLGPGVLKRQLKGPNKGD